MGFDFYSCNLEGRQLEIGESGLLPALEVVRAICDAGFQENETFLYENAKPPKDGMFMLKVTSKVDGLSTLVFFDTRTNPDYVWVQNGATTEFMDMLANLLSDASHQYGWKLSLAHFIPSVIQNFDLFMSAMAYVKEYFLGVVPAFYTYVKDVNRVWEVMEILHQKLEHKNRAKLMMKVLRAAYDADLIEKPEFESFILEFNKGGKICIASFNRYMTKENLFADDTDYQRYLADFISLKRSYTENS